MPPGPPEISPTRDSSAASETPSPGSDRSDAVLEVVANFSEGRSQTFVAAAVEAYALAGCEALDASMDPDHNRSVVTAIGSPQAVEAGAVASVRLARERIDMREHRGVHPRIGALDVLPFVPLRGASMADARVLARRVGARVASMGLPVYFYGRASDPPGRPLAEIRRGGFEALARASPGDRAPADLPAAAPSGRGRLRFAHPTAGAVCVGARSVLLAWNVDVEGVSLGAAREIAARVRERGGGFRGLRALAFRLEAQGRTQISMNLEDLTASKPIDVFEAVERRVTRLGGWAAGVEVVGMIPDALTAADAARMGVRDWTEERMLGRRVARHSRARALGRSGGAVAHGPSATTFRR